MTKTEPHQDWQTDANPALPHWQATVLTLFPDMFPGHLAHSLAGKSLNEGIWALKTLDIRDFARDKHRTVDDNLACLSPIDNHLLILHVYHP